ncbi:MAG: UvrD-helicase domain-containing protein [Muribaculaceae bacterium]|nr:UvrD-helicase domain-containing protein [Muribaculaceae bacterium]
MHTDKNLHVIKASAGAGKTFTLAKIYIEQLLWDKKGNLRPKHCNYHQHILAITFTNKATAEMKERIVVRLHELSLGTCVHYEKDFLKAHPSTTPEQLKEAAKCALEDILFDYTAFNVSTIDSFFQTVLRTFVYELDREYDYELQLDEKYAMYQAVQSLMQTIGEGRNTGHIGKWVEEYVESQVNSKSDWNFFGNSMVNNLAEFAQALGKETIMKHHDQIREYLKDMGNGSGISRLSKFAKALAKIRKECEDGINNFHTRVAELLNEMNVDVSQMKKNSPLVKLAQFSDLKSLGNSVNTILSYAESESTEKILKCFKKDVLCEDQIQNKIPQLHELLKEYAALVEKEKVVKDIFSNLWQLGLLGKIDEYLEQYRKDNNLILISDTADLIEKVLDSGVPFLYERMGVWLNHFMIDEFQDTSRKQYTNFKPLLENSLSDGHSNLIIGDEKQSIYRFRNSDPDLFQTALPTEFSAEYNDSVSLETNRRSTKMVIDFNNEFFRKVLEYYKANHVSYTKLQKTYSKLHQEYPEMENKEDEAKRVKGFVKLNVVYGKPTKNTGPLPYIYKSAGGEEFYGKEGVLKCLPEYILDQHERLGYPFGKILVLVNTNGEGDEVVKAILEHNQQNPDRLISIVSAESLKLQNSAAVRMVVSVLHFINSTQFTQDEDAAEDTKDEASGNKQSAEQALMKKRLREQLFYKTLHDFGQAMGQADASADFGKLLANVFRANDELRKKPVDEQVAIFAEQLQKILPNPKNEQSNLVGVVDKIIMEYLEPIGLNKGAETSFLLAFQGVVLDFCSQRSNGGTIYEFLKYWNTKKDKLASVRDQNDNAVKVMTIHKAKGLERPCVIVPFAEWEMGKTDRLVWVPCKYWLHSGEEDKPFLGVPSDGDESIVPPLIPMSGNLLNKLPEFASFASPQMEECVIDSLNKSYVAFTRPRQALHIFSQALPQNFEADSITKINEHLLTYFPNLEGCVAVNSSITGMEGRLAYYSLGIEDDYEAPSADSEDDSENDDEMMPDYTVKPALAKLKVKLPELVTESQESGNRLHRIMSRIRTLNDANRAFEYAVRRRIIEDEGNHYWNIERTKQFIDRLITDPQTAQWYAVGNKVYNERSIFIPASGAEEAKHLRPDRIVRTKDGRTLVIDYKFGDEPSAKQQAGYERQVKRYCSILSKLWNTTVEGYLLHAKSFTIQKVV